MINKECTDDDGMPRIVSKAEVNARAQERADHGSIDFYELNDACDHLVNVGDEEDLDPADLIDTGMKMHFRAAAKGMGVYVIEFSADGIYQCYFIADSIDLAWERFLSAVVE